MILIAVGLGYYILDANYSGVSNGYDGISLALGYFYTLGPALAGFAAWDISRFRTLLKQRSRARELWRTVFRRLGTPSLVTLLSVLLIMGYYGGLSVSQTWAGILLSVLLTCLWALFGAALGMYLSPIISLPVAVFIPWVLTAYPQAVPDPAWRQMFGQTIGGCCTVDAMIDTVTIRSSVVTLGLLVVASVILIQVSVARRPVRVGGISTSLIITCIAIALGYVLGTSGNFMNTALRSGAERDCDDRVCVWPESNRSMVDTNLRVAEKLGIPTGTVLVDGEPRNDNELWISGDPDPTTVEQQLIVQLLEKSPELRGMESCWVDETGRRMSLADEATVALGSSDLVPIATGADGRFLAYSNTEDPSAWDRVVELINQKSGCPA
ncbi:hypothetical protein ACTXMA_15060 [Corynebacterium variabile]|uniref:hypothetical protein n=1 Tax=Corynebacterium variabile TaxID=1727 RepID=UPI0026478F33|nr:hypothetical protein [Corynebacterium variabile]MDN6478885.1 hypothetical protein [Corynebacterium variabile]